MLKIIKKLNKQELYFDFFKIILLHFFIFSIGVFFNYWHYKFSYEVFIDRNLNGIALYFIVYLILATFERFILSLIYKKEAFFTLKYRERLYEKIIINIDLKNTHLACQKISEDIGVFFEIIVNTFIPFLFKILNFLIYSFIIFSILKNTYIVIFCIVYSIISGFVVQKLDNDLFKIESSLENEEALFRRELIRKFEDKDKYVPSFAKIKELSMYIIKRKANLKFRNSLIAKIPSFLKYFITLPFYIKGLISFPVLRQSVEVLNNLFDSSNFLIQKREDLIKLQSVHFRLKSLM